MVTDWYPQQVEVHQDGSAINVTFNLAPPNLGITSYFSFCYANGMKNYTNITPVSGYNSCLSFSFVSLFVFICPICYCITYVTCMK